MSFSILANSSENLFLDRCIFCLASFASILPPLAAINALKISPLFFWSGCGSTFSSLAILCLSRAISWARRAIHIFQIGDAILQGLDGPGDDLLELARG